MTSVTSRAPSTQAPTRRAKVEAGRLLAPLVEEHHPLPVGDPVEQRRRLLVPGPGRPGGLAGLRDLLDRELHVAGDALRVLLHRRGVEPGPVPAHREESDAHRGSLPRRRPPEGGRENEPEGSLASDGACGAILHHQDTEANHGTDPDGLRCCNPFPLRLRIGRPGGREQRRERAVRRCLDRFLRWAAKRVRTIPGSR